MESIKGKEEVICVLLNGDSNHSKSSPIFKTLWASFRISGMAEAK